MANRICWHCGSASHMTRHKDAFPLTTFSPPENGAPLAAFYTCDNCMWPNAAVGGEHTGVGNNSIHERADHTWYPEAATGRDFEDVPGYIAGAADEAFKCFSFHAFRSSVLMARSVVEATCKEKGITSGPLVTKIDALETAGHIRPHIKDAAHEIRHLGNDMAHGDFVDPVLTEEAEEILEFMSEILHDVFQSPAKIARRKAAREAREAVTGMNA